MFFCLSFEVHRLFQIELCFLYLNVDSGRRVILLLLFFTGSLSFSVELCFIYINDDSDRSVFFSWIFSILVMLFQPLQSCDIFQHF